MKKLLLFGFVLAAVSGCSDGQLDVETGHYYYGYADADAQLTACGICHEDVQTSWLETSHADAWATLVGENADGRTDCQPCHVLGFDTSESDNGFDDVATAGGDSVSLVDVQCEACHNAFDRHTGSRTAAFTPPADACVDCHSGDDYPYQDDLALNGINVSNDLVDGYVAENEECAICHTTDGFLRSHGVTGYGTDLDYPVTCFACHDPHDATNKDELRFPIKGSELCGECHSAEGLSPGSVVHHNQASMLGGTDGYEYSGETYSNSAHTNSGIIRDEGCPRCHMFVAEEGMPETESGETGHRFHAALESCTLCHGQVDSFNVYQAQDEIQDLLSQLHTLLGTFNSDSDSYKRALYNYQFVMRDGSLGVHNFRYARKLLQDSIDDAPFDH